MLYKRRIRKKPFIRDFIFRPRRAVHVLKSGGNLNFLVSYEPFKISYILRETRQLFWLSNRANLDSNLTGPVFPLYWIAGATIWWLRAAVSATVYQKLGFMRYFYKDMYPERSWSLYRVLPAVSNDIIALSAHERYVLLRCEELASTWYHFVSGMLVLSNEASVSALSALTAQIQGIFSRLSRSGSTVNAAGFNGNIIAACAVLAQFCKDFASLVRPQNRASGEVKAIIISSAGPIWRYSLNTYRQLRDLDRKSLNLYYNRTKVPRSIWRVPHRLNGWKIYPLEKKWEAEYGSPLWEGETLRPSPKYRRLLKFWHKGRIKMAQQFSKFVIRTRRAQLAIRRFNYLRPSIVSKKDVFLRVARLMARRAVRKRRTFIHTKKRAQRKLRFRGRFLATRSRASIRPGYIRSNSRIRGGQIRTHKSRKEAVFNKRRRTFIHTKKRAQRKLRFRGRSITTPTPAEVKYFKHGGHVIHLRRHWANTSMKSIALKSLFRSIRPGLFYICRYFRTITGDAAAWQVAQLDAGFSSIHQFMTRLSQIRQYGLRGLFWSSKGVTAWPKVNRNKWLFYRVSRLSPTARLMHFYHATDMLMTARRVGRWSAWYLKFFSQFIKRHAWDRRVDLGVRYVVVGLYRWLIRARDSIFRYMSGFSTLFWNNYQLRFWFKKVYQHYRSFEKRGLLNNPLLQDYSQSLRFALKNTARVLVRALIKSQDLVNTVHTIPGPRIEVQVPNTLSVTDWPTLYLSARQSAEFWNKTLKLGPMGSSREFAHELVLVAGYVAHVRANNYTCNYYNTLISMHYLLTYLKQNSDTNDT